MERLQPQVVITHDPYGGYGHLDHIHVHEAATAAFQRAAERNRQPDSRLPMKLYYTVPDTRLPKAMVRIMPLFGQDPTAFGRNKDINFVEIAQWEMPVHARIDVSGQLTQDCCQHGARQPVRRRARLPAHPAVAPAHGWVRHLYARLSCAGRAAERDLFEGLGYRRRRSAATNFTDFTKQRV